MAYENGKPYYLIPTCATGDAEYNQKILNKQVQPIALNTQGTGSHYNNRNVNVYSLDWSTDMQWKVMIYDGFARILCACDTSYGLDYYYGSNNQGNCDIYKVSGNDEDSKINFKTINASENLYKIQCYRNNNDNDLYLTATGTANGTDVRWQVLDSSKAAYQTWWLVPVENVSDNNSSGNNTPSTPSNTISINLRNEISSYNQRSQEKYKQACVGICGCMAINKHPDEIPYEYVYPANWSALANIAGKTAHAVDSLSLSYVLNLLEQGCPVIVKTRSSATSSFGDHWVIIYGYAGSSTNVHESSFLCIDPWGVNETNEHGFECSLDASSHFDNVCRIVHFY